jgi:hypothetical protein
MTIGGTGPSESGWYNQLYGKRLTDVWTTTSQRSFPAKSTNRINLSQGSIQNLKVLMVVIAETRSAHFDLNDTSDVTTIDRTSIQQSDFRPYLYQKVHLL